MRAYVDVLRQVFRTAGAVDGEGRPIETTELFAWEHVRARLPRPVRCQSSEISIPYAGEGALGVQPWVSALESEPADPPIELAAVGPQMIALTAEIADGWYPWGFAPGMMPATCLQPPNRACAFTPSCGHVARSRPRLRALNVPPFG